MRSHQPKGRELDSKGFYSLFNGIFGFGPKDRRLIIFVDMPHGDMTDAPDWRWLRELAAMARFLLPKKGPHGFTTVDLLAYPATGADGAPLPEEATRWPWGLPDKMEDLKDWAQRISIAEALNFADCAVFLTCYSATHQLKRLVADGHLSVRIATLPGFTAEMMPALAVDFVEAARRTAIIKALLDQAVSAGVQTAIGQVRYDLNVDLRHPSPEYDRLASTGRILVPGQVGNGIPAEAYVAPYDGADSETAGWLPIQFALDEEPILYRFAHNRVVEVTGNSSLAHAERALLERDPTRGNLGELGFGVLDGLGVPPLRDVRDPDAVMLRLEKEFFHVAFGTGGRIKAPIHRDHVFLKDYMPQIRLVSVILSMADGTTCQVVSNGEYISDLFSLGV